MRIGGVNVPVSIAFLGLLDTVATVGSAAVIPGAEGHMAWADGTMELPDEAVFPGLIKRCVHFTAAHEQRLCFPLDSVRRPDGRYPSYASEVVYPGMHSDVGGGYPRGDQGKGNYGSNEVDGFLLSQIALHDLYAEAFTCGAPLKVPSVVLPVELQRDEWRKMASIVQIDFAVLPSLIDRFNAWRELTLKLPAAAVQHGQDETEYNPVRSGHPIEQVIEEQMAWITAWRIERYGRGSYMIAPFFERATNEHGNPLDRENAEKAREAEQKKVEAERLKIQWDPKNFGRFVVLPAGPKDFDPDLAKTQISQAAGEFQEDYNGKSRRVTGGFYQQSEMVVQNSIFIYNDHDETGDYEKMKASGNKYVKILFPDAGESSNATQPAGLVRALFDDQVHDSRAWFMHAVLGSREPFGGYFLYRKIFFGEESNKSATADAAMRKGWVENHFLAKPFRPKVAPSVADELSVPSEVYQKVGENYVRDLSDNGLPLYNGNPGSLLSGIWK